MSEHRIEIVGVELQKHPNADTLSIVKVKGYQVIVKTEDWVDDTLGIYIPPDYVVPIRPDNEYLAKQCHITWGRLKNKEPPNDWIKEHILLPKEKKEKKK